MPFYLVFFIENLSSVECESLNIIELKGVDNIYDMDGRIFSISAVMLSASREFRENAQQQNCYKI